MVEVSAPGKLYIAGEYAVVETGHPAIIVAIDQFVTVTVKVAGKSGVSNLHNIAKCLCVGQDEKANSF